MYTLVTYIYIYILIYEQADLTGTKESKRKGPQTADLVFWSFPEFLKDHFQTPFTWIGPGITSQHEKNI